MTHTPKSLLQFLQSASDADVTMDHVDLAAYFAALLGDDNPVVVEIRDALIWGAKQ